MCIDHPRLSTQRGGVVNNHAPFQMSEPFGQERDQTLRLVTLCGSIKPLFSGTDDFHETLVAVLRRRQVDARTVVLKRWGLAQVPELLRQTSSERPDAILMQYPTDAFGAALGPHAFSALQRQAPLIVTLHEFTATNPIRRASLILLLARSAAVITTAETERRSLVSWCPWLEHRTCVIPIAANFPGREWRPSDRPLVVYFGQIRPEKGLEEFIACQDALAPRFSNAKFVIAGSRVPRFASYYRTIEKEVRMRDIELLCEMLPDNVPDFLRTATVALLPFPSGASFRRGSLLAAAVCGVPIVTLRGAETPTEMARLLEPSTSRDGLVAQVATYLSDSAARNVAHDRSRQLAALVSWDAIADRYLELISRLTAGRPAA
jgi:glycosyltransferase involved in cell wall biosynthesis